MTTAHRVARAIALSLLLASPAALADGAKPHIDRATELHKEGKFAEALKELELAYALDPQPNLLYAIGQVHVKLGQCADAISFYERFLATNPDPGPAGAAKQAIEVCKTAPPPAEVKPEPTPVPKPVEQPPPPRETVLAPAPWYMDKLGDALVGVGVISGVIGIVMYRGATSDLDHAESATSYPESQKLVDSGHSKRTIALIAGVGGIALIGAGLVHYALGARPMEEHRIAIVPTSDGGLVTWGGRF